MTYTRLPARRQRPRSGIERAPPRIWNRHRRYIRSFCCCVPGCLRTPIEVSHLRNAANSGTGLKPGDWDAVGMCGGPDPEAHHGEYHRLGHDSFEAKYKISLYAIAEQLVKSSPDTAMKEALGLMLHRRG